MVKGLGKTPQLVSWAEIQIQDGQLPTTLPFSHGDCPSQGTSALTGNSLGHGPTHRGFSFHA